MAGKGLNNAKAKIGEDIRILERRLGSRLYELERFANMITLDWLQGRGMRSL